MKIERLNENQIRCTLSKEDLTSRKLQLSELTLGSEKAKDLFQEMMEQAQHEVGFQAENAPLMIDAIPVSSETLVLVVTKVDSPEVFDERISHLSKLAEADFEFGAEEPFDEEVEAEEDEESVPGEDVMGYLTRKAAQIREALDSMQKEEKEEPDLSSLYLSFDNLTAAESYCSFIAPIFAGESRLYKDTTAGKYFLILERGASEEELFLRAQNFAADFAQESNDSYAADAFYAEHHHLILEEDAVATLAGLRR